MTLALDWLLSPVPLRTFTEDLWDRQPQLIRHERGYFRDLFATSDFDAVLAHSQPRPPHLVVTKTGDSPRVSDYSQRDGRLDINQLRYFYSQGYTLIINGLEHFWDPVSTLVHTMIAQLSFRVEANAYLTPIGSQGLRPHFDTHNVLVAQLAGSKLWRIYDERERLPRTDSAPPGPMSRDDLGEPTLVVEAREGDVLFIPRGWVHEAEATDSSSLHLTLGMYAPLWHEVMARAIDVLAARNEALRESVPIGFLRNDASRKLMGDQFERLLKVVGSSSVDDAISMIEDDYVRLGRGVPDGQFISDLDRLDSIGPGTMLERRSAIFARVVTDETRAALQFSRSIVQASLNHYEAMKFVVETEGAFAVSELPMLDEDEQIGLARQLVRDGLLRFSVRERPHYPAMQLID